MKALILAAGIASRLRPLTDNKPKCLLEVGSRTLLERTIDGLVENKIDQLVLVTGYLHEMIEDFISTRYPDLNVEYIYNEKFESTNNIYSLWLAKEAVSEDDLLLLDSDILFDPALVSALLNSSYPNCLALDKHPLGEEEIKVITDSSGQIREISKVCSPEKALGESIGIEKMSVDFVQTLYAELDSMILKEKQVNVFYEAAFENVIRKGAAIYALDTSAYFSMELDTPEDFESACSRIPFHLL